MHELFEQMGAVLPVQLHSHEGRGYLQEFINEGTTRPESNADATIVVRMTESHQLVPRAESVGVKTPHTFFTCGGGDTGDYDDYFEDPFGDWAPSDFSLMETVKIVGQRLEPVGSFGFLPVSPYEYDFLNHGGGGASDMPCAAGTQHVDWGFVKQSEGYVNHGYMVYNNDGSIPPSSGITIASGFDLGQHSASDIDHIGLSAGTAAQLKQYVGLKGYTAEAYLYTHPAVYLTPQEGELINSWAHSETLIRTVVAYDNAAGTGAFYKLPEAAQTALADAAFQWGSLANSKNSDMRDFWQDAVSKDWSSAISDLKDAADSGYASRRMREAALLENAMSNGKLHDGGLC